MALPNYQSTDAKIFKEFRAAYDTPRHLYHFTIESMNKMAFIVDDLNSSDATYINMAPSYDGLAFEAACNLAIEGRVQPSGYTEPILHKTRLKFKA